MFGKSTGGDAVIVARETHEGMYRSGINLQAPTGLYHHVYDYIADVTPDDGGAVFRATMVELFQSDLQYRPVRGDTVRVEIHKGTEVKLERRSLEERAKADKAAGRSSFGALANAAPGTATPAPPVQLPERTGNSQVDYLNMSIAGAQASGDQAKLANLEAKLEAVLNGGDPKAVDGPPASPAAPAASTEDPLDRLAKLAELHKSGVLTNEEFAAQKAKILG